MTIDDTLKLYTKSIVDLLSEENPTLIECKIKTINDKIVSPMMKSYYNLPFNIRKQFLRSKLGNVKVIDSALFVEFSLELPQ